MKAIALTILLISSAGADVCRVLVDGAGCRTRQLAMQRIWEELPEVEEVEILSRDQSPAANQRFFLIRSSGQSPNRDQLIKALGRRAKHYHVLTVSPEPKEEPESSAERQSTSRVPTPDSPQEPKVST